MIFSIITGNTTSLAEAAVNGAGKAVELTLSLCGMMCLWNGVMNIAKDGGALKTLSKIMSPLMRVLFRDAWQKNNGIEEITASVSANVLGIGNAATPLAINAMMRLAENNDHGEEASEDMVTFTVLGTASVNIIPTTIITLRSAAGSSDPFEVVAPIWICSAICAFAAIIFSKAGYRLSKEKETAIKRSALFPEAQDRAFAKRNKPFSRNSSFSKSKNFLRNKAFFQKDSFLKKDGGGQND